MKKWIFVLTYKHRGFLLSCGSESLAMHDQILSWSFISPRFTQSHQHIFYTDLCCSLAHWLFLTWLADIVMAWVLSQWLSPLPTFFWVIVERRKERRKGKYHDSEYSPGILLCTWFCRSEKRISSPTQCHFLLICTFIASCNPMISQSAVLPSLVPYCSALQILLCSRDLPTWHLAPLVL